MTRQALTGWVVAPVGHVFLDPLGIDNMLECKVPERRDRYRDAFLTEPAMSAAESVRRANFESSTILKISRVISPLTLFIMGVV